MEDYADIPTKAERLRALRQDTYFNALQVKFAYAVTCHKAQGGQWQHVYVDQGYMTDDMLTPDYIHWLYTASRVPPTSSSWSTASQPVRVGLRQDVIALAFPSVCSVVRMAGGLVGSLFFLAFRRNICAKSHDEPSFSLFLQVNKH
jgi:hypothetical protein